MEFKLLRIEKSDQILLKSSDDHHQFSSHVRSYTCTFCKRGFSNAQALGGHMNIHRRDRAKLKESSGDRSLLPFDITKKSPSDDHDSSQPESSDEKICSPKRPSVLSKGGDGVGEVQKLYLFVETPSSSNEEKREQLSHGSSHAEVDLELRLGLEHHETTTK